MDQIKVYLSTTMCSFHGKNHSYLKNSLRLLSRYQGNRDLLAIKQITFCVEL